MKTYMLLFALLVVFAACDKPSTTVDPSKDPNNPQNAPDTSFVIAGVADITMGNADTGMVALAISHTGGVQAKLNFSLSGLPANTTSAFDPASGTAPFTTTLEIRTHMAPAGTYPVTLTVTTASGNKKNYSFNLVVQEKTECGLYFFQNSSGQFASISILPDGSTTAYTAAEIAYDNNWKVLYFVDMPVKPAPDQYISIPSTAVFDHMAFTVDCTNKTLTIPNQVVRGYNASAGPPQDFVVNGTGTIDWTGKKYTVTYTSVSPSMQTFKFTINGVLN